MTRHNITHYSAYREARKEFVGPSLLRVLGELAALVICFAVFLLIVLGA